MMPFGRNLSLPLVVAVFALTASHAIAQVYKCDTPSGIVYSQIPCAPDAQKLFERSSPRGQPSGPRPSTARNETQQAIHTWCASQWPDDFRMQKHCYDKQIEAAGKAAVLRDRVARTSALQAAADACAEQWKIPEAYDFRMVNHCVTRQIEA